MGGRFLKPISETPISAGSTVYQNTLMKSNDIQYTKLDTVGIRNFGVALDH